MVKILEQILKSCITSKSQFWIFKYTDDRQNIKFLFHGINNNTKKHPFNKFVLKFLFCCAARNYQQAKIGHRNFKN